MHDARPRRVSPARHPQRTDTGTTVAGVSVPAGKGDACRKRVPGQRAEGRQDPGRLRLRGAARLSRHPHVGVLPALVRREHVCRLHRLGVHRRGVDHGAVPRHFPTVQITDRAVFDPSLLFAKIMYSIFALAVHALINWLASRSRGSAKKRNATPLARCRHRLDRRGSDDSTAMTMSEEIQIVEFRPTSPTT